MRNYVFCFLSQTNMVLQIWCYFSNFAKIGKKNVGASVRFTLPYLTLPYLTLP